MSMTKINKFSNGTNSFALESCADSRIQFWRDLLKWRQCASAHETGQKVKREKIRQIRIDANIRKWRVHKAVENSYQICLGFFV